MIALFVDVQNLFYSVRDTFGSEARVDFKKLMSAALNNREAELKGCAYVAHYSTPESATSSLVGALQTIGYGVRVKQVKKRHGKFTDTDMDQAIILDVMDLLNTNTEVDTVVVASGDKDFIPMYQRLKERGVRVEILAFQGSLSQDLPHVVDEIRVLGKSILYNDLYNEKPNGSNERGPAKGRHSSPGRDGTDPGGGT